MLKHKHINKIGIVILVICIAVTFLFMNAEKLGIESVETNMGYETKLFDTSKVHTIDIIMDDWDSFIENCTSKEYSTCTVIIDDEKLTNVAIRAKGNSSLSQVESSDSDRYSFKIEFDHYDKTNLYYGLDKLCLNNIIQDNTYMKDYLSYQLMNEFDVASPLCSYINISVNGENWGLYLAVESIEESFLQRNFGNDYGELYKPESEGNMPGDKQPADAQNTYGVNTPEMEPAEMPSSDAIIPQGARPQNMGSNIEGEALEYIDDEYDSYSYIFDNAVTDVSNSDKDKIIEALNIISENSNMEDAVDIEEVIRYFVVHNFVLNFDSYTGSIMHNYYLYEDDGILSMLPWDYNLAFSSFMTSIDTSSLVNFPIDTPVSTGTVESRPMLSWIFENEEYTELYHELFTEFLDDISKSDYFAQTIDEVKEMISPYVEEDPTKFCTFEEFEIGIDTLKEFCLLRAESITAQLEGSIGITSEGQQNNENFVDASHIDAVDMGSENTEKRQNNMSPENTENGQDNMSPENTEIGQDNMGPENTENGQDNMSPENTENGQDNMGPPNQGMKRPNENLNNENPTGAAIVQTNNNSVLILLGISGAALLLGLIIVFLAKKRQ